MQKNADQLKPWLAAGQIHIENHGLTCRPLSVTGKGVKNHSGTSGVDDVFEEVRGEAETLAGLLLEIKGDFLQKGEELVLGQFTFKVDSIEKRRIKKIKVTIQIENDEE